MTIQRNRMLFHPENEGGAPPPAAPDFASMLADVPEDVRNDSSLKDIKDIKGLVSGYVNAQRMVGYDKIAIPSKPDSPDWENVWAKLGRPAKPEEYKFGEVQSRLPVQEPVKKDFMATAHKIGLSQRQADELYKWYMTSGDKMVGEQEETARRLQAEATNKLKQEYGAAYDDKVAIARQALRSLGDDELLSFLDQTRLGDHPALVRTFVKIGQMLKEDGKLEGGGRESHAMSPAEAKARIAEKRADADFMQRYQNGDAEAKKEMDALYRDAHPETAA
jgi:hypothetical protein